ncbi:DUF934 domain-containing protein [Massilia atriviolacea]|uniref:DUF934 domain-containing protein n=1 Tax=Massilia atriviolacea TaxID=2495579 RepID=A0A430HHU5_9BURK|nr:DUF934 domain-containing protein [Massilia atriviolacea]RSZ57079.1 DUF934 domain-containing protein [Massilia atriviolacea]
MLESHKEIIKQRAVVADDWSVLRLAQADPEAGSAAEAPDAVVVPEGKVIVPLAVWQAQRAALSARADIGVWLAPDERAEALKGELDRFAVVAIDFPKFTDGRGYSTAFNLRMRLGYTGELRAIGDVLRDQLFQMQRCGFDAFATRQDRNIHDALKGLTDFSEVYQASVDVKAPLFRRHERDVRIDSSDAGYGI